jgi:hypothetical protein
MFEKPTRYFVTAIKKDLFSWLHLRSIGVHFLTEYRKRTVTANSAFLVHSEETVGDMTVYIFYFRWFIEFEP